MSKYKKYNKPYPTIPLDGDIYGEYEEGIASEEWSMPEEGIIHGLSVVCECDWIEE